MLKLRFVDASLREVPVMLDEVSVAARGPLMTTSCSFEARERLVDKLSFLISMILLYSVLVSLMLFLSRLVRPGCVVFIMF